jgi:hypothetical protein
MGVTGVTAVADKTPDGPEGVTPPKVLEEEPTGRPGRHTEAQTQSKKIKE